MLVCYTKHKILLHFRNEKKTTQLHKCITRAHPYYNKLYVTVVSIERR